MNVNYTDATALVNLHLTKDFESGTTTVTNVSYVPLLVLNRGAGAGDQYYIMDVHAAMQSYEAGDTSVVSSNVYSKLQYALEGCHAILGEAYDYANAPANPDQTAEASA